MSVITVPGRHDVRSYGAAGDGMTDDREAVQAACDAAESEGGGLVLLPAGAYKVGACGAQPWCLRVGAGVAQNTIRAADRGIRVLGTAAGFPQLVLAWNAVAPSVAIPLDLSAGIVLVN